jgi:hypothetical protein
MRIGEGQKPAPEKRASVAPKGKSGGGADDGKATSIGELIKQKLGEKLMGKDKKGAEKAEEPAATDEAKEEDKDDEET